jgi:hypothetical protein
VHDIVLVAVVDAGQDLFDQDGAIFFGELASGDDLVEELSSFADPFKV